VTLYDINNDIDFTDMIVNSSYTFTCPAYVLQNFQIICTETHPLTILLNPYPPDGSLDVETEIIFNWTGSDLDLGDSATYDIYFGTTINPLKIISNQSAKTYNPGKLENNKVYYWKIISHKIYGTTISSPIWNFTTKKSEESNFQETTIQKVAIRLNYLSQKLLNRSVN
jgi:hypothetical protein